MKERLMCNPIYLDNGATTRYKPISSQIALIRSCFRSANAGRGSHNDSLNSAMQIEACRNAIRQATFDGNVILTKNCTEAINLALKGMQLSGEIITTVFEHNSVLRTLEAIKSKGNITVKCITPASISTSVDDIIPHLTSKTKLIVMGEMNNVTGAKHDIATISRMCKQRNILLMVDTAQSLGHTTTDYSNVDILACSGHKGLHGPQGTGFLVVRDKISITPLICGGTGTDSLNPTQPKTIPEGQESGTLNSIGFIALAKSIQWTIKHRHKIMYRLEHLSAYLLQELAKIKNIKVYSEDTNGVISFNIKNADCGAVADILNNEYGIAVRAGLHCAPLTHKYLKTSPSGAIRVSIGYNNRKSDIKELIRALKTISAQY